MAKWPVLARNDHATTWLQAWEVLGRAPRTLDAYARGLAEYLALREGEAVDPLSAGRTHVGLFVRDQDRGVRHQQQGRERKENPEDALPASSQSVL
ncbi:hypothetical protein [Streptomyces sp. NPDC001076]